MMELSSRYPPGAVGEGDAARAQQALLLVVLHLRHVAAELMAVVLVAAEWGDVEQLVSVLPFSGIIEHQKDKSRLLMRWMRQ